MTKNILLIIFCAVFFASGMVGGGLIERHRWEGRSLIQNVRITCPDGHPHHTLLDLSAVDKICGVATLEAIPKTNTVWELHNEFVN